MKEILMPVLHDILGMTPYLFEASIIGLAALIFRKPSSMGTTK